MPRAHGVRIRTGALLLAPLLVVAACSSSPTDQAGPGDTTAQAGGGPATTARPPFTRPSTQTGPVPTVTGPVTGGDKGKPNTAAPAPLLSSAGYVEDEFFLAGDATSYQPSETWGQDGEWAVTPAGTAPYATRALVRRPSSPEKFNGTVLVEWLNVSVGADVAVDFGYLNRELLDRGYIYVGVSVQKVGHEATKQSDPTRYEPLVHPGDLFSYDIFTQAGRATATNALFPASYQVRKLIADGESQSAGRMVTYINAVQPVADVYDGFLVHSRGDRMTPVAPDQPAVPPPFIRTDLRTPTLVVLSETDVLGNLGSRQEDSDRYRRYEVAGTAHVDNYDLAVLSGSDPTKPAALGSTCEKPINNAHQYWVMNAGLRHLTEWIGDGPPPPTAERMTISAENTYVTDEHGNAEGGIRLPDVEVPISTLTGLGNNPSWCRLYGTTTPFDAAKLAQLYPDHASYTKAHDAAVDRLLAQGLVLERDATAGKAEAAAAPVPG